MIIKYFGKFSLVGISGVIVNQGLLLLFKSLFGLPLIWAGIIAIESSIITNYIFNASWTWQDRHDGDHIVSFPKYQLIALFSGSINYLILLRLHSLAVHFLLANMVGITVAIFINFLCNHFWTFRSKEISEEQKVMTTTSDT